MIRHPCGLYDQTFMRSVWWDNDWRQIEVFFCDWFFVHGLSMFGCPDSVDYSCLCETRSLSFCHKTWHVINGGEFLPTVNVYSIASFTSISPKQSCLLWYYQMSISVIWCWCVICWFEFCQHVIGWLRSAAAKWVMLIGWKLNSICLHAVFWYIYIYIYIYMYGCKIQNGYVHSRAKLWKHIKHKKLQKWKCNKNWKYNKKHYFLKIILCNVYNHVHA